MTGQRSELLAPLLAALGLALVAASCGNQGGHAAGERGLESAPTPLHGPVRHWPQLPTQVEPNIVAVRESSAAQMLKGNACIDSFGAEPGPQPESLELDAAGGDWAYAVYQFSDADEGGASAYHGLQVTFSQWTGEFYLGYSSYPRGAWIWQRFDAVPADATQELLIPATDGLFNPQGAAFFAVVVDGLSGVTINSLKLVYDALAVQDFGAGTPRSAYNVPLSWSYNDFASSFELYVQVPGSAPESRELLLILPAGSTAARHGLAPPNDNGMPILDNDPLCEYARDYQYSLRAIGNCQGELIFGPLATYGPARRELAPPQNVVASQGQSADSVSIFWDPVPEAESYRVYRDGATKSFATAIACGDCAYETAGDGSSVVLDGQPHSYQVEALAAPGSSPLSEAATGFVGPVADYIIDETLDIQGRLNPESGPAAEPVLLAYDATIQRPVFLSAANTRPVSSNEWSWHALDFGIPGLGEHCDIILNSNTGRYGAVLSDSAGGQTWFAQSADASPDTIDDWNLTLLDAGGSAEYCSVSRLYDHFAVTFYRPGTGLVFAVSSNDSPSGAGDWTVDVIDAGAQCGLFADMDSAGQEIFYWAPDPLQAESWVLRHADIQIIESEPLAWTWQSEDLAQSSEASVVSSDVSTWPGLPGWAVSYLPRPGDDLYQRGWHADGGPGGGEFGPRGGSFFKLGSLYPGSQLEDISTPGSNWAWSFLDSEWGSQLIFQRSMYRNFRVYSVWSALLPFSSKAGRVTTGLLSQGHWYSAYTTGGQAGPMYLHWRCELNLPPQN